MSFIPPQMSSFLSRTCHTFRVGTPTKIIGTTASVITATGALAAAWRKIDNPLTQEGKKWRADVQAKLDEVLDPIELEPAVPGGVIAGGKPAVRGTDPQQDLKRLQGAKGAIENIADKERCGAAKRLLKELDAQIKTLGDAPEAQTQAASLQKINGQLSTTWSCAKWTCEETHDRQQLAFRVLGCAFAIALAYRLGVGHALLRAVRVIS